MYVVRRRKRPLPPQEFAGVVEKRRRRADVGRFIGRKRAGMRKMRSRNLRTAGLLGVEKKRFMSGAATATLPQDWPGGEVDPIAFNTLFAPQMGTQWDQRDGARVIVTDIAITGYVSGTRKSDQADANTSSPWRISLVLDTQTNGSQMSAEDCYADGLNFPSCGIRSPTHLPRFKVLKTWTGCCEWKYIQTDGANTGSQAASREWFSCYLKDINIPIEFDSTAGAITVNNLLCNSLHLIGCSEEATTWVTYDACIKFVG